MPVPWAWAEAVAWPADRGGESPLAGKGQSTAFTAIERGLALRKQWRMQGDTILRNALSSLY